MTQPFIQITVVTARDLGLQFDRVDDDFRRRLFNALGAAGLIVQNAARKSILVGPKTGRVYQRGSVTHRASAPGEAPANDTGRLVASIVFRVDESGTSVDITAGTVYAKFLEFGTRKMEPRPFMNPALINNLDKVRAAMRAILSTSTRPGNARRR